MQFTKTAMRYRRMGLARHNLLLNLNLLKSLNPEPGIPRNEGFKVIILQRPFGAVQRAFFGCLLCIHRNRWYNFWNGTACVRRWIVTWLLILNSYFVCIPTFVITRNVFGVIMRTVRLSEDYLTTCYHLLLQTPCTLFSLSRSWQLIVLSFSCRDDLGSSDLSTVDLALLPGYPDEDELELVLIFHCPPLLSCWCLIHYQAIVGDIKVDNYCLIYINSFYICLHAKG